MFRSGAHETIALVGLATAIYATASLTGGLGTPPWWEKWEAWMTLPEYSAYLEKGGPGVKELDALWKSGRMYGTGTTIMRLEPREGREAISGSIAAVGLALFAWAAWPRRERHEQDEGASL